MQKYVLFVIALSLICVIGLCACTQNPPVATDPNPTPAPTTVPSETVADPVPEPVYPQNQVLYLSFDNNVDDHSALELETTMNKQGTYVEGVSGQALYFDGSTYIDLGTSTELQPASLTFSCWIKADGALAGEHMITWFKPNGNYQGEGWYLSCLDDNTPLKLSVGKSTGQPMEIYVSGSRSDFFPAGQWVHIAVTYDSATHTCNIYRNGIAQNVTYINTEREINQDSASHKYVGFNSPGYKGGFCKLSMDEMEIYSTVLPASAIIDLYTQFGAEFDTASVVQTDYNNLNLSFLSLSSDIILPTSGASGSQIVWTSSNEAFLTADGKVTRPLSGESSQNVTLTATLTYGDCTMTKTFDVTVEALPAFTDLQDFSMGDVTLLDAYESNALSKEIYYLKSLNADMLLKGFCNIGGVESNATLYGGWENSAIKGHTLGHYLTAVSQAYASTGDAGLLDIADHIVDILSQCQNAQTGYLAAIPESHYNQIAKGNTSGTWVPWYTMHKVLAGLVDCWELTGNANALTVAANLGDWVYSHTSTWTEATQLKVLSVEYGGMNDVLYRLYSHTGSEDHLAAAHSFDEMALFQFLYNGEDCLNGLHANTTIPKILGALQRYMVLGEGEEYYLQVAENFWEIVVNNHTYITGGNSEWEHFGQSNILDAERTNCNCETCNTYNMLKLTRELFKITGNPKYADYYENTFINAILSSQNPETGMTTYFQPMATGYFKVYSTATGNFWCCTGSGMENFSKLGDSIYYHDNDAIYVTRFTSSTVTWAEKGLTLTQSVDFAKSETVSITVSGSGDAKIVLRVPDWCAGEPTVAVNGKTVDFQIVNGFITLTRNWQDGDTIAYTVPMEVIAYTLPDDENVVAFKYGPFVLSANLGNDDLSTSTTGVSVTIPLADSTISDVIAVQNGSRADWLANLAANMVKTEDAMEFTIHGTNVDYVFSAHYQQHENRYGIYFYLVDSDTELETDESDNYIIIDTLPVGNDQYEFSHNLESSGSASGSWNGLIYRDASPNGWFSYDLAVEQGVANYLCVKYYSGDAGRTFSIYIDGTLLEDVTIENVKPGDFYTVYYEIPAALTDGKQTINVKFQANSSSYAGGIFDRLSTVKEKD